MKECCCWPSGVKPVTSWSPAGSATKWAAEAGYGSFCVILRKKEKEQNRQMRGKKEMEEEEGKCKGHATIGILICFLPSSGPKVIKLFSCSTQLSMKFVLLINIKLLTIAISFSLNLAEHENFSANKYENANYHMSYGVQIIRVNKNCLVWSSMTQSTLLSCPANQDT